MSTPWRCSWLADVGVATEEGEALVGFGRVTVYVERTDSDGLKWLSRRKWP